MCFRDDPLPTLSEAIQPPVVRGIADLTSFAYAGHDHAALIDRIHASTDDHRAVRYDSAIAEQLAFRPVSGMMMMDHALDDCQVYRIGRAPPSALRVLALSGPNDLMLNTSLDFLTNGRDIRLDLLYLLPNRPLPPVIPDHDVAFFAQGAADPEMLSRLCALFAAWPRPALNHPKFLPGVERETLSRSLSGIPTICSPTAVAISRDALEAHLRSGQPVPGLNPIDATYPLLIRPIDSHAGHSLALMRCSVDLTDYLRLSPEQNFFLTAFEDYRSPDGQYRKSRVAFIDRNPFLCHLAISDHWMVHYLNAGMTESALKRAQEAQAMADFDTGFARRHAAAFSALHERLGFDYYSIDCAETPDGRLLVFEADAAAIVHLMDPVEVFPYKHPQMRKVFAAFESMLRRRASQAPDRFRLSPTAPAPPATLHVLASGKVQSPRAESHQ